MNIYETRQLLKSRSIFDLNINVAYYARVSTEKVEQKSSIENQRDYYEEFIRKNPSWKFVDGYIDEGFSGIDTSKRESFQKMLADAKNGKIDLIITKEISRFARNTLDSILYTRQLLSFGVAVWFQNDNINTIDSDSEMRFSIMAAIAQEEVRKLSERVRFGHSRSIQKGVVMGNSMIYGWDKKDGTLVINEKEAEMVRIIFCKYATGKWTTPMIEEFLWEQGYRNRKGGKINRGVIGHIITNPKYKGYYVGGKVKIVDYISKKQEFLPESEWVQFKDDGSRVPAIIDEETWDIANKFFKERGTAIKDHRTSIKRENVFTGIIKCADDGACYWKKYHSVRYKDQPTWVCSHKIKEGSDSCLSFPIKENELKEIIVQLFTQMIADPESIIRLYMSLYEQVAKEKTGLNSKLHQLEKEVAKLKEKREKILDLNLEGDISDAEFKERNKIFSEEIQEKEKAIAKIRNNTPSEKEFKESINKLLCHLNEIAVLTPDNITQFVVKETIEKIVVKPLSKHEAELSFYFKTDMQPFIKNIEGCSDHIVFTI